MRMAIFDGGDVSWAGARATRTISSSTAMKNNQAPTTNVVCGIHRGMASRPLAMSLNS